jgi:hypothetical protein
MPHQKAGIELNTAGIRFLKYIISGCDLFIGCDSAPAHIAVAYDKKAIIFCGSVNPELAYPDLDRNRVAILQQECIHQHCWHTVMGGTEGKPCVFNAEKPPCCVHDAYDVIKKINELEYI